MSSVLDSKFTSAQQPEQVHPAFEWLRSQAIESLNLTVEEYRHRNTGALHYHLSADNPENVFLVALRTVPVDSTGVAHILEHTALCGSKKYPVRDPFFMMIRRSLNTFMNAFTSSDWTAYPFASQHRKDFFNLMDVYLDAVFFSRLDELDFAQEGHRFEFTEADNSDSDLLYKGVVYNEMKGALSSPISRVWEALYKYLYPTTTYHYNSGGEPEHIPDLSYEQLRAFYKTHYHPSNAVFMSYGDIPAYEHHTVYEENALKQFAPLAQKISVPDEKRYLAPVAVEEFYGVDSPEEVANKTHVVMGWLLGHNTDLEGVLSSHLLSSLLLDNSASPLRQALETTDLGTAPSSLCGLDDSNHELTFMCGLEGCDEKAAEQVETLVMQVLQEVADRGIAQEQVEAALHQLELGQREVGGDGYPYGLQLILEGLSSAIHRGDPVALLNLDPVLEKLREQIKQPDYIKNLLRNNLLDNLHRVRLTMKPDAELNQHSEQAERDRLRQIKLRLDAHSKQKIIEQARQLAERQAAEDDIEILPRVGIKDIPATMHIATGTTKIVNQHTLSLYAQPTNGLVYQQVISALPPLTPEQLILLPHYSSSIASLGCDDRDYLAMQNWQYQVTGGVNAFNLMRAGIHDAQTIDGYFALSSKALKHNGQQLTELLHTNYKDVRFDEYERLAELIAQKRARAEQSVTGNGHVLAMLAASAGVSAAANLSHTLRGLAGIHALKQLDDGIKQTQSAEQLADQFTRIHESVLKMPTQFLLIAEQEELATCQEQLVKIWSVLQQPAVQDAPHFVYQDAPQPVNDCWLTNTQVNFCAKAYPTVTSQHPDAAALSVLAVFMRNGFLHTAIREQGGAYGGGAGFDADTSAFRFYSYRDPRLLETLEDFDKAIDWVLNTNHDEQKLEEAVLGVIGSLDKPGSPAGEAKDAFQSLLFNRTPELRQQFRRNILSVQVADLKRVAEYYLKPEQAHTAVISSEAIIKNYSAHGMQLKQV